MTPAASSSESLATAGPRDSDRRELPAHHREVVPGSRFLDRRDVAALASAVTRSREHFLAESAHDPSARVAAEWLYDNDYLVRRVLAQLRTELPPGFQRRLPRLAADGRPRVLAVAEAIAGEREPGFDLERIESFLRAYQEETPLTIAELWALPMLLRLVILRRFCALALEPTPGPERPSLDPGSAAGRMVRALRLLDEVDWKELFCRHSVTERLLAEDPAGAYAAMDFQTRDAYRRAVEELAIAARRPEVQVARAALERARAATPDRRKEHVGEWLVGKERSALARDLGAREPGLERSLLAHPRIAFLGLFALAHVALLVPVAAFCIAARYPPSRTILVLLLTWIPASVPAMTMVHRLLTGLIRPRLLPKLDFSLGVPQRWRTLVAIPTLLGNREEIDRLLAQLELHYLSNPDPELRFALLTDHPDADTPGGEEQDARLAHAERGVRALNTRHGRDGPGPFHLLHRAPRWNPAERKWMGWERKRGKLEELNRYLRGDTETSFAVHVGAPAELERVAFVLTLDSDTQLPPGAAARLVGALAHPLNRPRAGPGGRVREGYTVIQPRVEISPRSARRSPFSRLLSGDTGIDIYTRAVPELYHDLFGEGIYVGKGIYDVDEFHRCLEGRVPENALVSHDLFEGIHGRVGLASDVVIYEDFPPHYLAYLLRLHRWVRGDWQLLPWLLPRVPGTGGRKLSNRLDLLDRFKIGDNLRRSLVAPSLVALLTCGWFLLPAEAMLWAFLAALSPGAASLWSMLRRARIPRAELSRWLLTLCFLPQEALTVIDAIIRVLARLAWSHRRMLEWTTSSEVARRLSGTGLSSHLGLLWAGPVAALLIGTGLAILSPQVLPWAAPWLLLWLASPEVARRLDRPSPSGPEPADPGSERTLRQIARRTWLFYESFVGPRDHWLPPDNFQEHPLGEAAHRTSPTNIGMLLLSELAAYDLGYLGPLELSAWISNTLDTIERLERHRGHLYNWYDTLTLTPLEPRYVSTVDSGNLAGALIALSEGCQRLARDPPLRPQTRLALLDTSELLLAALTRWARGTDESGPAAAARRLAAEMAARLAGAGRWDRTLLEETIERIEALDARLIEGLHTEGPLIHDAALLRGLRLWFDRLAHQVKQARRELEVLAPEALPGQPPSLEAIGDACNRAIAQCASEEGRSALERTRAEATALSGRLHELARRARALAETMDFRFLYDGTRRLFHVGFNVSGDRVDPHHYDLLASEARLASYLAVVWRQVPLQHWFALGRPLARMDHSGPALLSWGGSMFEYLMPGLLMRSSEDTLLHHSCRAAVDRQIAYGRDRGTPWGISESGFAFLDGRKAYQYHAFGVPGLGLRRGLEEDLVIAPYASLLAVGLRPREVMKNIDRLIELGMLGRYGMYEAADFHPRRRAGARPARVLSYMAHHQGMGLVAITNYLCRDAMVERFHGDRVIASGALLLDERAPNEVAVEQLPTEVAPSPDVAPTPPPVLGGWEPDRSTMQVWALGNDRLTSFVTAEGGGGLAWRDLAITRWEPDPAADAHGIWLYLRDQESGETIGASPAPVGGWPADARVRFEAGSVEFHRRHRGLAIRLRVTVASGEDVELRELELTNVGDVERRIRVVGCLEPVLEPERRAAQHPAFSRLFLRCSPLPEQAGVLVSRAGGDDRLSPEVLFRMVGDPASEPRLFSVDRGAFLGRGGSPRAPAALGRNGRFLSARTLDPLCACAAELLLPPGSSRSVALVTAVAESREEAVDLGRRFGAAAAVRWAFEDSARAASHRAQRLGTPSELLPQIQQLLSALLVPVPELRAPAEVLNRAHPAQHRLWGRGISGDEPMVVVRLRAGETGSLLDELLAAHRHLRSLAVPMDLVLIDETRSGYEESDPQGLRRLLARHQATALLRQRGGIHIVAADQARGDELDDLAAAARVYFDSRDGSLREQLERARAVMPAVLPRFEAAGPPPGAPADPQLSVGVPSLELDNGFGGFAGHEYLVRPGASPPSPWCNVLANEIFGCLASEAVLGSSWSLNAGENRLTPWHNDPVLDPPSEVLYLRDQETARVWSTTPRPTGVPTLVRHGLGYTTYQLACAGLEQAMTVFVPPGLPLKVVWLRLRNASARPRRLTATYYAEWVLGPRRAETRHWVVPTLAAGDSCLCAETSWSMDFAGRVAFLAADRALHGYTTDRVEVLGRGGDLGHPAALERLGLSGRVSAGLDPCAALQVHLELGPLEETEVCFFLGQGDDRQGALDLVRRMRAPGAVESAWRSCRDYWESRLGAIRVRTPDTALDRLCNGRLLYQSLASRFFGRTAFYQSSGAFGFRDQLQDVLAFIHCDPALTRRHLLEAASHQFELGDVLHWWHPPGGAGVRTRCSDDLLWLVFVTAEYVEATGDRDVLGERVPFLAGEPLAEGEDSRYGRYAAGEVATLLEHCRRALARGLTAGPHGLPLIGEGDWNDGMNRVGSAGRGESIWLGWFAYACVERFARLLEGMGQEAEAQAWRARLAPLAQALAGPGWDGNWYVRAYHDDGSAMGSARSAPPHIDLIAQSWAVLSGAGEPRQIEQALAAAERMLVKPDDRLVLLLAPPFGPRGPDPGYIAGYPAGVRENGGQYTHAAAWLGWAYARRGDGAAAHRIFSLLNPLERTRTREGVERYVVEPYVLAADVYARPPWTGRGGWTWYTGAAAWTWRLAIEEILGLRRRGGALEIDPCLPPSWDGFEAWVREGEVVAHVVVHNPHHSGRGVDRVTVDGQPTQRARVELAGRGEREVEIWLGTGVDARSG